jgi:uncharacterized membrane protein
MQNIAVEKYVSIGFQLGKTSYWLILFNTIIYFALSVLVAITVIGLAVLPALITGYCKFLLKVTRGEEVVIADSFSEGFKNGMWWKTLLYSLIMIIGVAIGYILLIIPGIYLSIAWSFGFYLVIDKNMTPLDALQKSREIVHQVGFWKILILNIIVGVLGILQIIPILGVLLYILMYPFISMLIPAVYENAIGGSLVHTDKN